MEKFLPIVFLLFREFRFKDLKYMTRLKVGRYMTFKESKIIFILFNPQVTKIVK